MLDRSSMVKCPACENESEPGTMFCPRCGTSLSGAPPVYEDPDSNAKTASLVLYGLGGMMAFFSFGFLLPGLLTDNAFLIVSAVLVMVAVIFFTAGYGIKLKERKHIEHLRKEWVENGKCEYCGMQNPPMNQKCASCGAPLLRPR